MTLCPIEVEANMNVELLWLCNTYYIFQILGAIVVSITVVFTIRTFWKIKDQTGILQEQLNFNQNAVLRMEIKTAKKLEGSIIQDYMQNDIHQRVVTCVQSKYPRINIISEDEYITIALSNHGFTDIVKVIVDYTIKIDLASLEPIPPDLSILNTLTGKITLDTLIKTDKTPITLALSPAYAFPKYDVDILVSYSDAREKKYDNIKKTFSGKTKDFEYASHMLEKSKQTSVDKPDER